MTRKAHLTLEDVADFPEDFYYELLGGEVVPIPPPLPVHQCIIADVVKALGSNARRHYLPVHSVSVAIGSYDGPCPDLLLLHQRSFLVSPVPVSDVILVGEVLQKAPEPTDRGYKADLYARGGIPAYWIIDPLADRVTLTAFLLGSDGVYHELATTGGLVTLDHPWKVELDLPAMTRRRDRIHSADRPYR